MWPVPDKKTSFQSQDRHYGLWTILSDVNSVVYVLEFWICWKVLLQLSLVAVIALDLVSAPCSITGICKFIFHFVVCASSLLCHLVVIWSSIRILDHSPHHCKMGHCRRYISIFTMRCYA